MDSKQTPINYLYFLGMFAFLVLLTASSIFSRTNLGGSQFFFFLYAVGQVFLEVILFIFFGVWIRRSLGKLCFALFIGGTFVALTLHLFDFLMDRVLALSLWETVDIFILHESWENFLYLLDASGVPIWMWIALSILCAALPAIGILLYKMSDKASQRKPLYIRNGHFLQAFLCIPCALVFWDFSASKVIHPDAYTAFIKSLPWKFTFLQPSNVLLSLPGPMRPPLQESEVAAAIDRDPTRLNHKPNIYLFVVESLREDVITEDIAPHLHRFKMESLHFDHAISNANGSHISWFSIFHSQFPYHWCQFQQTWQMGSPALNLLKKWGYQIHLYSSAQLSYYGMEKLLFGQNLQLLDSRQTFHHFPPIQAADTDAEALAKLQSDLAKNPALQEGQIFIIFWDCTHFDYSWPKNWTPKFTPFAQEFAYFKAFHSEKTIHQIKNRYRNAVNYMDSLFGDFFEHLPNKEEAIVMFTGDHAEEFFEHGHLFHNSHLTREQTHIPLYLKFGTQERAIEQRPVVSQMDIFPTLLDYLSNRVVPFLEGHSLFQAAEWPYAITARFNAGRTPYEFSIHNGKNKLIAQFLNRNQIAASKQLQILSLRTFDDQSIPYFKNNVESWVHTEFGPAIDNLFQKNAER